MKDSVKLLDTGVTTFSKVTDNPILVISYYWGENNINPNSTDLLTYGQQANRLASDCERFGLDYHIVHYSVFHERKLYQLALGLKAHFIYKCMQEFPDHKVIFLDSDLRILQYPSIFDTDADAFFLNWKELLQDDCYTPYQIELPGAVLGFGNTFGGLQLIKLLKKEMEKNLFLAEDKIFSSFITKNFLNVPLRIVWLPQNYMYMMQTHVYDPEIGKYTKVASLEEDVRDTSIYTERDIVIMHKDFETGELKDVFETRVGKKNRFPNSYFKDMGKKLRCQKETFLNYIDFGITRPQRLHYLKDFINHDNFDVYKPKKIKPIQSVELETVLEGVFDRRYGVPSLVSIVEFDTPEKVVSRFTSSCELHGLNYRIYKAGNSNKAEFLHAALSLATGPICYMDIYTRINTFPALIYTKNIDFMCINLFDTPVESAKCTDPRILKTLNGALLFLRKSDIVFQFLCIWNEFEKKKEYSHKTLEYAFNASLAVNKLRCFWLPKSYVLGPVLKYDNDRFDIFFNDNYKKNSTKKASKLAVCGVKPDLNNGAATAAHHRGSRSGVSGRLQYKKYFMKLF